ncbi:MAG: hypothetical protein NTU61_03475 [Candidatus Altiarchaeota archaeon]|nr:hypothetical protein [Candidatus Altiarchaeota archaeon]
MSDYRLELRRKLFHLILGSSIAFAVYYLKPVYGNLVLIPLVLGVFVMLLIPRVHPKSRVSNHMLYKFERKKDIENFPFKGAIHYGIGVFFPILLLDVKTACMIIMVLSVGDAFSTLIGKFHGRYRIHQLGFKSIEGTMAFMIFSIPAAMIFVDWTLAVKFGLIGAFVELLSPWDDNFTVPAVLTVTAILLQ